MTTKFASASFPRRCRSPLGAGVAVVLGGVALARAADQPKESNAPAAGVAADRRVVADDGPGAELALDLDAAQLDLRTARVQAELLRAIAKDVRGRVEAGTGPDRAAALKADLKVVRADAEVGRAELRLRRAELRQRRAAAAARGAGVPDPAAAAAPPAAAGGLALSNRKADPEADGPMSPDAKLKLWQDEYVQQVIIVNGKPVNLKEVTADFTAEVARREAARPPAPPVRNEEVARLYAQAIDLIAKDPALALARLKSIRRFPRETWPVDLDARTKQAEDSLQKLVAD
jgi:hypothetical protein